MLRLPLLNLASRETNRLPASEINRKLGCGGVYGGSYLPLELQQVPQVSDGKFVVYYSSDFYGELPPNHSLQSLARRKATFLLVKVDGCREQVIDEGEVENDLKIHGINMASKPWSHFIATGKVLGRFSFYCTSPEFNEAPTTTQVPQSVAGDGFKGLIDKLAADRR